MHKCIAHPSTRSGQRLLRCALLFSHRLPACPGGHCPRTPVTAQTHCLRLTSSASHSATSDTFFLPCLRSFCVLAPRPRHCASVSRDHLHPRRHHRRGVHLVFLLPLFSIAIGFSFDYPSTGPRTSSGAANTHKQLDLLESRGRGTASRGICRLGLRHPRRLARRSDRHRSRSAACDAFTGDVCTVEFALVCRRAPAAACGYEHVRSHAYLVHAACYLAHELVCI